MSSGGDYKPTEHGGLREDGQPDGRVGTGQFAQGKVDPKAAGHEGGKTQPEQHKPTENDGKKVTGEPDPRVKGN